MNNIKCILHDVRPLTMIGRYLFASIVILAMAGCGLSQPSSALPGTPSPQTPVAAETVPPPTATTWLPAPGQPGSWPTQGWQVATPESQGMDSQKLAEMYAFIADRKINLHGLVIARHGVIVTEAYFDPYRAETRHEIASLTKSVMGALVGTAIEQGKMPEVSRQMVSFFPGRTMDELDEDKQAIRLEDLLTLSTGMDCSDFDGREGQMHASADWVQFVLDLPMIHVPGETWDYCSSVVHLLSAMLTTATGESTRDYANRELFAPLGIEPVPDQAWNRDPQGVYSGGNGLRLAPRDLAKFASLYLYQGNWNGRQIVSQEWVRASLQPHIYVGNDPNYGGEPRYYGYLWSVFPESRYFAAFGMGGQHIYVFPDQDLVIVFTAATPSNVLQLELVHSFILPAVKSAGSLPANQEAVARMNTAAAAFSAPKQPVQQLPDIAMEISGKTILLDDNPFGWKQFTLTFVPGRDVAGLNVDGMNAEVGLDNIYRVVRPPDQPAQAFKATWLDATHFNLRVSRLETFTEYDIKLTFESGQVILTVSDVVWGGLVRIEGKPIN